MSIGRFAACTFCDGPHQLWREAESQLPISLMASLRPNLVKRIDRLPKPTNVATAMQPLFEAISNSIHSTQAKFGESATAQGRVVVTINTNRKKEGVWATVEDNGVGCEIACNVVPLRGVFRVED